MQIPTKLYKYQPFATYSLENLKSRQLWFAAPASFNDPFDCGAAIADGSMSAAEIEAVIARAEADGIERRRIRLRSNPDATPTEAVREGLEKVGQKMLEERQRLHRHERGVACFSECVDDPLMWAHYADGHRGFCLEFSTDDPAFEKARPVSYRETIPAIRTVDLVLERPVDLVEALILTKQACWSYEREWRSIHMQANTLYAVDWRALTGIFFGAAMAPVHKEILSLLLRDSPTKLYEMRRRKDCFGVTPFVVDYIPFRYDPSPIPPAT